MKTKHYIIAYSWRRTGSAETDHGNDFHRGTLAQWILDMKENQELADFALLNAIQISAADYRKLTA